MSRPSKISTLAPYQGVYVEILPSKHNCLKIVGGWFISLRLLENVMTSVFEGLNVTCHLAAHTCSLARSSFSFCAVNSGL